jgi:hypothetical protein
MIRECFLADTGIQFHHDSFKAIGLDPVTLYPFVTPRSEPLKATSSIVVELRASARKAEATEATSTNEAQASPIAASTFESEENEELADIISPIYDRLKSSPGWWILEILPLRHNEQNRKVLLWKPYWLYVFFLKVPFVFPLHVTHLGVIALLSGSTGVAPVEFQNRLVKGRRKFSCIVL